MQQLTDILETKKIEEIQCLTVPEQVGSVRFVLIGTALSTVQARAVADEIRMRWKEKGSMPVFEGYSPGDWIAIDLGDIFVHLLSPEKRSIYSLEKIWEKTGGDGSPLSVE